MFYPNIKTQDQEHSRQVLDHLLSVCDRSCQSKESQTPPLAYDNSEN